MIHPDDKLHVILDALGHLRDDIEAGEIRPWEDYDEDDGDPKTTREDYVAVLAVAEDRVTGWLSEGSR